MYTYPMPQAKLPSSLVGQFSANYGAPSYADYYSGRSGQQQTFQPVNYGLPNRQQLLNSFPARQFRIGGGFGSYGSPRSASPLVARPSGPMFGNPYSSLPAGYSVRPAHTQNMGMGGDMSMLLPMLLGGGGGALGMLMPYLSSMGITGMMRRG